MARPEEAPLKEAERASNELALLEIKNQLLLINGVLTAKDDLLSQQLWEKQQTALEQMPERLKSLAVYTIPLRSYNISGLKNLRGHLRDGFGTAR